VSADKSSRNLLTLLVSLLLLLLWTGWFLVAEIASYKKSDNAQLKEAKSTLEINTAVTGKLNSLDIELGMRVKQGDVLFNIDMSALAVSIQSSLSAISQLKSDLQAIEHERSNLKITQTIALKASESTLAQLNKKQKSFQPIVAIQADISERYKKLHLEQKGAELDYLEAQKTYQEHLLTNQQITADIENTQLQLATLKQTHKQALAQLARRESDVIKQLAEVTEAYEQQQIQTTYYQVRSPVDGIIASLSPISTGHILKAGESVATLLTETDLYIEAQFSPEEALGHIRVGQPARVELTGFAWTQFGSLEAEVTHVANAVQNNHVRVKLSIKGAPPESLPLQHDLPATVEVQVARLTPAGLVLQKTATWMQPKQPSHHANTLASH
jgi:membrane fusion protein (multidrug efflux system)